jgi:hypothetical protein
MKNYRMGIRYEGNFTDRDQYVLKGRRMLRSIKWTSVETNISDGTRHEL